MIVGQPALPHSDFCAVVAPCQALVATILAILRGTLLLPYSIDVFSDHEGALCPEQLPHLQAELQV